MDARIVVAVNGTIETVMLKDVLTVGRNPGNDLVLADEIVSRNHALIRRDGERYFVIDQGSSNGTFLNGQPVGIATKLNSGDDISMGETVLSFYHQQAEEQAPIDVDTSEQTARVFAPVTLSIFVTDIRNYTTLSEQIPSEEFSQILSGWFNIAGRCIARHGGTIEHFRGDNVAAYWVSKPEDNCKNYIVQAVKTAQEMVKEAKVLNEEISARFPGKAFNIGCGVHMGKAVFGNIGTDARRDFTILGDSVNVAFRIEGLCSTLKKEVLVSEAIKDAVTESFKFDDMGLHGLKGKAGKFRLFTLDGT